MKAQERSSSGQRKKLNFLEELYRQRRNRFIVMSLLMLNLLISVIYGTLENPFIYTLSNIGNFFTYREAFIVWAMIAGFSIQSACLALFRLENYKQKRHFSFIVYASIALVLTAIIPALKDSFPFWHYIHLLTALFYALFLILGLLPFIRFISRENPRLSKAIRIWEYVIMGGSILSLIIFGKSGIFELWFVTSVTMFLLYLSLILYEENIVKISVELLRDEKDLNEGIEKIFVPDNPARSPSDKKFRK
ncbi:MAG: hypothetical protein K0B52_02390 [FCB group bacterium]|nr:hypothetical protein [FCB group bacterium]